MPKAAGLFDLSLFPNHYGEGTSVLHEGSSGVSWNSCTHPFFFSAGLQKQIFYHVFGSFSLEFKATCVPHVLRYILFRSIKVGHQSSCSSCLCHMIEPTVAPPVRKLHVQTRNCDANIEHKWTKSLFFLLSGGRRPGHTQKDGGGRVMGVQTAPSPPTLTPDPQHPSSSLIDSRCLLRPSSYAQDVQKISKLLQLNGNIFCLSSSLSMKPLGPCFLFLSFLAWLVETR